MKILMITIGSIILSIVPSLKKLKLEITSPSFEGAGYIPSKFTCEGQNINPELDIKNIPEGAVSLALIVDDPDASKKTFTHWLLWNIPSTVTTIKENSAPGTQGKNDAGENKYHGPCPPKGMHRYFFKVYALDVKLDLKPGADKQTLEDSIKNHVLAKGEMIGLYKKMK